jgi:hypothetical protein
VSFGVARGSSFLPRLLDRASRLGRALLCLSENGAASGPLAVGHSAGSWPGFRGRASGVAQPARRAARRGGRRTSLISGVRARDAHDVGAGGRSPGSAVLWVVGPDLAPGQPWGLCESARAAWRSWLSIWGPLLSRSQVSEMARNLEGQVKAFRTPATGRRPYAFLAVAEDP